ncbi:YceI family protein [Candidatus Poribacteria bacterium]|nr:YceI family protein [Candidatus Poribacteria bacterium]
MKMDLGRNLWFSRMRILVLALIGIGFAGSIQMVDAADTYEIDTAHSMVIFRAKHNGITYNYGRFNAFTGEITMDADVSKNMVEFEVKTASVDTGNEKRDQHLRSPDFFSAKQFPVITFKSTKVEMKEGKDDVLAVTGDLELLGVKKSITVDVEITGRGKGRQGEALIGFQSVFTINRSEFGMTYGAGSVSDDIQLTVSIEAQQR